MTPHSERAKLAERGVDLEAVFDNLDTGAPGKLVEIHDEHEGHLMETWIEWKDAKGPSVFWDDAPQATAMPM